MQIAMILPEFENVKQDGQAITVKKETNEIRYVHQDVMDPAKQNASCVFPMRTEIFQVCENVMRDGQVRIVQIMTGHVMGFAIYASDQLILIELVAG